MISVDVEVNRGDFCLSVSLQSDAGLIGLFGPSGSGKTTLIHLIAGLIRPHRGCIQIDDAILFASARNIDVPPRRRGVGLVYQDSLLFPHLPRPARFASSTSRSGAAAGLPPRSPGWR